jgi:hypothetical protein
VQALRQRLLAPGVGPSGGPGPRPRPGRAGPNLKAAPLGATDPGVRLALDHLEVEEARGGQPHALLTVVTLAGAPEPLGQGRPRQGRPAGGADPGVPNSRGVSSGVGGARSGQREGAGGTSWRPGGGPRAAGQAGSQGANGSVAVSGRGVGVALGPMTPQPGRPSSKPSVTGSTSRSEEGANGGGSTGRPSSEPTGGRLGGSLSGPGGARHGQGDPRALPRLAAAATKETFEQGTFKFS